MSGSEVLFSDLVVLGALTDFEPVVWLFPNTNVCPMKECGLSCADRNVALAHFHLYHAETAMKCTVCNHLFSVINPLNLFIHYKKKHPREKPPALKRANVDSTNYDSDGLRENDDIITLKGCGKTKRWCFPQQTHCTIRTCNASFSTRIAAIVHFKSEHANRSTFCDLCGTPILANHPDDLKRHNRQNHPQTETPITAKKQLQKKRMQTEQDGKGNEADIWLSLETRSEKVCWKFPNEKRCPVKNCCIAFKDRLAAIRHYKERHLPNATFCSSCNHPIYGLRPGDINKHYRRVHPQKQEPFKFREKKISPENDTSQENDNNNGEDDVVTLSGGGHITQWNFPENITICPVISCRLQFQNRLQAIDHYKERHAKYAILCSICNKPIRVDIHTNEFINHYRRSHPNEPLPLDFEGTAKTTTIDTPQKRMSVPTLTVQSDNDNENGSDLITLRGLKYITQWTFPETTKCPFLTCRQKCGTRSKAIAHYKNQHANHGILCTICNKPICVRGGSIGFRRHYLRIHPNVPMPFNFEVDTNGDDDRIRLTGFNQSTYWRFPQINHCPMKSCNIRFPSRPAAIVHYKSKHSMNLILCSLCNEPVSASSYNLQNHYKSKHRNASVPNDLIDLKENTKSIDDPNSSSKKNVHNLPRKAKEVHTSDNIVCPLIDCKYDTNQIYELRQHWEREHGELHFPEIRHGQYAINSTRPKDDNHQSNEKRQEHFPRTVEDGSNGSGLQFSHSASAPSEKLLSSDDNDNASSLQDAHENGSCSSSVNGSNKSESSDSDISEIEEEKRRKRVREMRKLNLRSRGNKRSRNMTRSDTSSGTTSSDDESSDTEIVTRRKTAKRYMTTSNHSNDEKMTNKITAETLPQCFVMLEQLNYPESTLNFGVMNTENGLSKSEAFYVPDSDEENQMEQESEMTEYDLESNSDASHIPRMGVLMMAKKTIPM